MTSVNGNGFVTVMLILLPDLVIGPCVIPLQLDTGVAIGVGVNVTVGISVAVGIAVIVDVAVGVGVSWITL